MHYLYLSYASANKKIAKAWLKQAVRQGSTSAEFDHASNLLNQRHLTKEQQTEAMVFMNSAAEKGYLYANSSIIGLYNNPEHGIKVSKEMALQAASRLSENLFDEFVEKNIVASATTTETSDKTNAPPPEIAEEIRTHAKIAYDLRKTNPSGAAHVLKALCNDNHEQALATTRPFIQKAIQSRMQHKTL
jgi:TPR repeat protein